MKLFTQNLVKLFLDAGSTFKYKRAGLLAAGGTFYIILSTVPFLLLIVRALGIWLGDLERSSTLIFEYGLRLVPNVAPEIILKIQSLLKGPLFQGGSFTIFNFLALLVGSLSFCNSIWSSLYLITEDKSYLGIKRMAKGVLVIASSFSLVVISLIVPFVINLIINFISNNFIVDYVTGIVPVIKPIIESLQNIEGILKSLLDAQITVFLLFIVYFSGLFRWIFDKSLGWRQSFAVGTFFVCFFSLAKEFFWIYLLFVRKRLLEQYGDFYTVIVALLWVFFSLALFYFSLCLCHSLRSKKYHFFVEKSHDSLAH